MANDWSFELDFLNYSSNKKTHIYDHTVNLTFFLRRFYKSIKRCDRQTAFLEAVQIAGFSEDEARNTFSTPRIIPRYKIIPLSAKRAEYLFLKRFNELYK